MLNLEVPQIHISLLVVLPFVVKYRILRIKFLEVQLKLLRASFSSVCASSVILLTISHQLFNRFNLARILVALVLDSEALLYKLIIFVSKALDLSLILLQDFIDADLEEFLKRSAFLGGRFYFNVGLLRGQKGLRLRELAFVGL